MITEEIDPGDPKYRRAIHSLRFLSDAFRGRRALLSDCEPILMQFTQSTFGSDDKVAVKHTLEAVGLISEEAAQHFIIQALTMDDEWISETAFRSYRYLSSVQTETEAKILRYLLNLPASTLLRRYQEISFSLGQSDRFHYIRRQLRLRYLDTLCALAGLFILAITHFFLLALLAAFVLFKALQDWASRARQWSRRGDRSLTFYSLISDLKWYMLTSVLVVPILVSILESMQSSEETSLFLPNFLRALSSTDLYLTSIEPQYFLWLQSITLALCFVLLSSPLNYTFNSRRKPSTITNVIYTNLGSILLYILIALLAIVFMFALVYMASKYKIAETVLRIFSGLILLVVAVEILRSVYFTARSLWADQSKYAEFTKVFGGSRAEIFVALQNLDTKYFRLKYVEWVERQSRGLEDVLAQTDNVWPDSRRPNYQDKASTLLAKIDERWLGFER